MAKSKAKQTKTFLKRGLLAPQIKNRQQARGFKQKVKGRTAKRDLERHKRTYKDREEVDKADEADEAVDPAESGDEDDEDVDVDDILGAQGLQDGDDAEEDDEDGSDLEDDNLSDLEDIEDPEKHMADLKALAEKDPEFYAYLQANDKDLLNFAGADAEEGEGSDEEDEEEDEEEASDDSEDEMEVDGKGKAKDKGKKAVKPTPVLTKEILKGWQKSILETRSIRSTRKLLLAFRSAASGGSEKDAEERTEGYEIQSAAVFNKVLVTTLKYMPIVLAQHVPYKEKDGKFKLNTNSKQYATVQRLLKSYFVSLHALLASVRSDSGIPSMAVSESAKLVPWVVGNRKIARAWTKLLLEKFESGSDEVRVAAFLALRKLAIASDHAVRETLMKGVYSTILGSARQTTVYTLPALTLMKNAASELFLLPGKQESELTYQLTFGYIRMLAILLRKGVKEGTKDAFKAVYNWQFVHAVDFWSLVLSASCDKERVAEKGPSPLKELLYPLIQVAMGAIRLVPTSRYYPLRFHLIRSLLRIVQRTGTYIPLSTPLFEVLDSPDLSRRSKNSSLKPLDWEYFIRAPVPYLKTRVYAEGMADELLYLLVEYYTALSTSIAFPELVLPAIVSLKRHAKKTTQGRLGSQLKVLVEKLEGNSKWIEERREKIDFAPNQRDKVDRFLQGEDTGVTPLGTYLKVQRKTREQKRATLEKAARDDAVDDL